MSVSALAQAPPHSVDAEMSLIAAMMYNNRAHDVVADMLRPEHFFNASLGLIFGVMTKLIGRGEGADPITLERHLAADGTLEAIGGRKYLWGLVEAHPTALNAAGYARAIHDCWLRRELITAGADLVAAASSPDGDQSSADIIEALDARLQEMTADHIKGGPVTMADALGDLLVRVEQAYQANGAIVGVPTGLSDLDIMLRGLSSGDLVILAGRPSMGKTAMAMDIAGGAARAGRRVGVFSLEMTKEQLAAREVAKLTGIPANTQLKGPLSDNDVHRIMGANDNLRDLPLDIDDQQGLTLAQIRMRARRLKRCRGLGLMVVDHIGLIPPARGQRFGTRALEIGDITAGLKALAKELDIPVLALCQLNRGVEGRDDKRPGLSDLRDSGSVEQDADVIMFVYREAYYLARQEPKQKVGQSAERFAAESADWQDRMARAANLAEIFIAKNRNGATGKVELHFDGPKTRFTGIARY